MPEIYRGFGSLWSTMNPGWEVIDWSWQSLPTDLANWSVCEDLISRCTRNPVGLATQLADVIAYELVYWCGGIYVNADIEPLRPLDELYERYSLSGRAWAGMEDEQFMVNAVFGGPQGHPFWAAVVRELPRRYERMVGGEMNQSTGPRLLTDVWAQDRGAVVALPFHVFNPVHWSQVPLGSQRASVEGVDLSRSWGVHHWGHRRIPRSNVVD
jgi:mannosyltransferase OCH1-like enzyme